jgi:hypothetical protein
VKNNACANSNNKACQCEIAKLQPSKKRESGKQQRAAADAKKADKYQQIQQMTALWVLSPSVLL